ncbi:cytochrome C oxidase subunit IV family protein [Desulfobaculum bizertense]|uniref:Cytochrome c oxidase subunit 4 n=1 Tax=Desulfobaculum bizertense DSM 18034 TaxID=1121442 RepID=A0A1T4VFP1_9BACT|nr:cytochrome C oxidase subunit IV family protein [Desulfobaculum bizertense]UIJ37747.1 cytochrome C oxidase subunit IV family protein [Desulfobaculum bizertense]SKA63779.1 cytochrome c oxidase subunit 4 [Desulfobaculum bizertense DSM 18034]
MQEGRELPILRYQGLVTVWILLLVLTVITVYVAGIDLGFANVAVALSVATCKAALVVLFFMHLRYESRVMGLMVLIACAVLAIFIGFTFFDVAYR